MVSLFTEVRPRPQERPAQELTEGTLICLVNIPGEMPGGQIDMRVNIRDTWPGEIHLEVATYRC